MAAADSGTLTKQFKEQLLQWIGRQTGKFVLIYSANRDGGLDPAIFHQQCDGRKPTVTVATNTAGYVFGGYIGLAWHQANSNTADSNPSTSFLFRLSANNVFDPKKAPCSNHERAIHGNGSYGPTFGYYQWLSFSGSGKLTGVHWTSDVTYNIDNAYKGMSCQEFNGANHLYTDFEVYEIQEGQDEHISLEKSPWRKGVNWKAEDLEKLKDYILNYNPLRQLNLKHTNILVVGQIGAGKSSFYNTLQSIFKGHVVHKARCGGGSHSVTTKYRKYDIWTDEEPLGIKLCDTMGVEEEGFDGADFQYILDGNIPDRFQFNPAARITPSIAGFIKNPTLGNMIHCVTIVMDGSTVSMMSDSIITKLKTIQSYANERGIPVVLLLTKIDHVCKFVQEDTSMALRSTNLQKIVKTVSDKFSVPTSSVLVVRNYEADMELDDYIDMLALVALRQMLRAATGFFEEHADRLAEDNLAALNIKPN
ncbi:unnamed protein product [Owenia fusiformis]|uniref:Uncharacterized protein n=1 Tax=Owenia fusiformis TaxID=6347 RepID=A0A8J1UTI5_OWEFU|nr:unnamed protein product [Owenia fusiformis]